MLAKLGAYGTLLAFLGLCWQCLHTNSSAIATGVQSLTAASLQAAPVPGVAVNVDGRDVTLTGRVANEEMKVLAGVVAWRAPGVRTVDNRLEIGLDAKSVQPEINKILLTRKIEFETARDVLLSRSIPVLEEILRALRQAPNLTIRIEGHTDSEGKPEANRALSRARAQSVVTWLAGHGIDARHLTAVGFGPDRPIASNTTPEGRAKNRRVEITVD